MPGSRCGCKGHCRRNVVQSLLVLRTDIKPLLNKYSSISLSVCLHDALYHYLFIVFIDPGGYAAQCSRKSHINQVDLRKRFMPPALSLTLSGITGELHQPPKIDIRALVEEITLLFII